MCNICNSSIWIFSILCTSFNAMFMHTYYTCIWSMLARAALLFTILRILMPLKNHKYSCLIPGTTNLQNERQWKFLIFILWTNNEAQLFKWMHSFERIASVVAYFILGISDTHTNTKHNFSAVIYVHDIFAGIYKSHYSHVYVNGHHLDTGLYTE